MSDETTKVPDIPCPKCGSADVRLFYQEAGWSPVRHDHKMCKDIVPEYTDTNGYAQLFEHFHRHCQRCHYAWPTVDVLLR